MKVKICPFCQHAYPEHLSWCPVCRHQESARGKMFLNALIVILILAIVCSTVLEYKIFRGVSADKNIFQVDLFNNLKKESQVSDLVEIPIRPMTSLSGLTKDEIYQKRIGYVRESIIFSKLKENYSPNEDVYNIVDNLPWISAYEVSKNGTDDNPNIGVGNSRHSIFINNPELLIGFIVPSFTNGEKNRKDFSEVDYLLPQKILWDEANNTIKAYFDLSSFFEKYPHVKGASFFFDETNARDMGYEWVFCEDRQGVAFDSKKNINTPYKMLGYYHRGYACGLEEGCNNYAPYQESLNFKILYGGSYLKLKFWEKEPVFKFQKADMNYEMYFE